MSLPLVFFFSKSPNHQKPRIDEPDFYQVLRLRKAPAIFLDIENWRRQFGDMAFKIGF